MRGFMFRHKNAQTRIPDTDSHSFWKPEFTQTPCPNMRGFMFTHNNAQTCKLIRTFAVFGNTNKRIHVSFLLLYRASDDWLELT